MNSRSSTESKDTHPPSNVQSGIVGGGSLNGTGLYTQGSLRSGLSSQSQANSFSSATVAANPTSISTSSSSTVSSHSAVVTATAARPKGIASQPPYASYAMPYGTQVQHTGYKEPKPCSGTSLHATCSVVLSLNISSMLAHPLFIS